VVEYQQTVSRLSVTNSLYNKACSAREHCVDQTYQANPLDVEFDTNEHRKKATLESVKLIEHYEENTWEGEENDSIS